MENRHTIRALDPQIVGKIAAGEVVERPAFAIKELIENSIDAGATSVSVQIRDGGLSYFRIVDNGCGIDPSDVRIAFMRHTTSKLRTEQDLYEIHTLGFRGEALHSVAAVSKVEMVTRRAGAEHGIKAVVEGGVMCAMQDAPSPEGTSITVRDLFYNTPARRKFLKKPVTEAGLVSDLVMRLIIARPDISFRLQNEEKKIYHSSGNGNLRDALLAVLGHDALSRLREVKGSAAGCALSGYIGVGDVARSSRTMQTFILNGRYVRNAFLSQALEEGCRESVMTGKYPICAIHLTMPFEAVDVNVHPNKLEVRFADERALMMGIAGIVRSALKEAPIQDAPKLSLAHDKDNAPLNAQTPAIISSAPAPITPSRPAQTLSDSAIRPSLQAEPTPLPSQSPLNPEQVTMLQVEQKKAALALRVFGVAWMEYAFTELGDTLYIIDQHAAHERILYERLKKALDQNTASQLLLTPQVVQLTHREHAALMTCKEDLRLCGFDIEDFGDRSIQVRAVPMVLGIPQIKGFLGELADRVSEYRAMPTQETRRDVLIQMACKKAVKAGDPLSTESIERLIDEMQETGAPPTCPHGRPIVVCIAKSELDKRFRRI